MESCCTLVLVNTCFSKTFGRSCGCCEGFLMPEEEVASLECCSPVRILGDLDGALSGGLCGLVTLIRTKSLPEVFLGIFVAVEAATIELAKPVLSSDGELDKCKVPFCTSRNVKTADLKSSQSPNVICKTLKNINPCFRANF